MSLKLGDYLRRQVKVGTKAAVVLNVVEVQFWRRKGLSILMFRGLEIFVQFLQ